MNPSSMPKRSGDRMKTERRDGDALARLHRAGDFTAIYLPTPDDEARRDLVRAREGAVGLSTQAKHRVKASLPPISASRSLRSTSRCRSTATRSMKPNAASNGSRINSANSRCRKVGISAQGGGPGSDDGRSVTPGPLLMFLSSNAAWGGGPRAGDCLPQPGDAVARARHGPREGSVGATGAGRRCGGPRPGLRARAVAPDLGWSKLSEQPTRNLSFSRPVDLHSAARRAATGMSRSTTTRSARRPPATLSVSWPIFRRRSSSTRCSGFRSCSRRSRPPSITAEPRDASS